jgi:hypothetical protein
LFTKKKAMEDNNEKRPVCPHGHTDEIIPCVYGLLTDEHIKKSWKMNLLTGWDVFADLMLLVVKSCRTVQRR